MVDAEEKGQKLGDKRLPEDSFSTKNIKKLLKKVREKRLTEVVKADIIVTD